MNLQDKDQFPKLSGIYKIKNILNNKCYIGSAVNVKVRLQRHLYELNTKTHNNQHLQRSFDKNGAKVFEIEFLELFNIIEYTELLNIEKSYILLFDSIENGYNLMLDNSSFFSNLNKTKKHIENNRNIQNKKVFAFNILTGSLDHKFDSITEASYYLNTSTSNISQVCKNKANYIKGYNFCYEEDYDENFDYKKPISSTKGRKMSESQRLNLMKSIQNNKGIKVYKYDLNYNFLEQYNSRNQAEILNNLKKESLKHRLDNKTPFEGFYWLSTKL